MTLNRKNLNLWGVGESSTYCKLFTKYTTSTAYDIADGKTITVAGTPAFFILKTEEPVIYFDGTNDYLSVADSEDFNMGAGNWTACAWIKYTTATQLFAIEQYTDINNELAFLWHSSNLLGAFEYISGSANFKFRCPFSPIAGIWYHICTVRNGNTPYVYINGASQPITEDTAISGKTLSNVSQPLTIGRYTASYFTTGYIRDACVFKGIALSAEQIRAFYDATYIE